MVFIYLFSSSVTPYGRATFPIGEGLLKLCQPTAKLQFTNHFHFIIPHFGDGLYQIFVNICELYVKFITKTPKKFTGFAQFVLFLGTYGEYHI